MYAVKKPTKGYAMGMAPTRSWTKCAQVQDIFEAPEAAVYLIINGTAANAVIPWDDVAAVANNLFAALRISTKTDATRQNFLWGETHWCRRTTARCRQMICDAKILAEENRSDAWAPARSLINYAE
jgi:hypothetical protein